MVSLAGARHVEVRELGLRSQGVKLFSGDPPVLADCVVNIPNLSSRDTQSVFETILPARPVAVRHCFIVTLALFVEARALQHGEEPGAT